ncbi:MAG: hypothetical protein AB8B77_07015 [Alphaproteobacteria bacterium]
MSDELNLTQEYALLDFANRLENHRDGRIALYFNLSQLKAQNRREHHLRVAISALEEPSGLYNGHIFPLANQDIVLILAHAQAEIIDDIIMRMRTLFSTDPLAVIEENNVVKQKASFVVIINVEANHEQFSRLAQNVLKREQARQKRLREINAQSTVRGGDTDKRNQALSLDQLSKIETMISKADLSNLLRRQAVCHITQQNPVRAIFIEVYIAISTLSQLVAPDAQLASNRWLFTHLTQTLDRRVLKILGSGDDGSLRQSISLNFNISTVLERDFLNYDANLNQEVRNTITIEFQFVDVVADFEGYIFARDFLKERGYRVCLDGVSSNHLPLINRAYLGVDLIKLASNHHFSLDANDEIKEYLAEHIKRIGPKRIILSRCDNNDVINTGSMFGIQLFQGFAVDQLLQKEAQKPAKQSFLEQAAAGNRPALNSDF